MAQNEELTTEAVEAEENLTSYTSESGAAEAAAPKKERPALTVAGAAVGRRKEAVARVRVVPGSGKWTINGRELANYFPNKLHQQDVNEPFKILDLDGAYDVIARIHGGGISGQAGALRLDARVIERKKAGLKKARKAQQYSKR